MERKTTAEGGVYWRKRELGGRKGNIYHWRGREKERLQRNPSLCSGERDKERKEGRKEIGEEGG
jgi:hypothetical protein